MDKPWGGESALKLDGRGGIEPRIPCHPTFEKGRRLQRRTGDVIDGGVTLVYRRYILTKTKSSSLYLVTRAQ